MLSPLFFILFPLAMYGIYKAFPFRKPDNYVPPNYEQLGKFTKWGKISGWFMLLFFVLIVYLVGWPLRDYREQALKPHGNAVFYVLPERFWWIFLGFMLALGLTAFFYTLITKIYMGADFKAFVVYYNQKVGYNPYKAIVPFFGGFVLLCLWLMACFWNYSIYAYPNKMVVRWFISADAKTYSYKQVKTITYTAETRNSGAQYELIFDDGQNWLTPAQLEDPNAARDLAFISKQASVKIDTLSGDTR